MKRLKINIIGNGNVAIHLRKAFSSKDHTDKSVETNMVNSRTFEGFDKQADLSIICVSDDAIKYVIENVPNHNGIMVHTSGTIPINVFNSDSEKIMKYGVLYPLQTFSKNIELNYREIPFYIEGSDKSTEEMLYEIANIISDKIYFADSNKRKILHLASVFACNFVNHMWGKSNEILSSVGIEFKDLLPLVQETLRKAAESKDPYKVQTGPAVRGDSTVLKSHLEYLENDKATQEIYKTISKSIELCRR